jgi:hypothetical protein
VVQGPAIVSLHSHNSRVCKHDILQNDRQTCVSVETKERLDRESDASSIVYLFHDSRTQKKEG